MYMLIMVLDDSSRLNEVLEAWSTVGIKGVTILESTGMNRVMPRENANPLFMGFSQMFGSGRVGHQTLFTVIDDLATAEAVVAATEAVVGQLNDPHTGIIFVVPVAKGWGIPENMAG